MKIILYSLNYAPEITGIGKYSGELGSWLAENGHEVRVICSPPYYPEWTRAKGYSSWRYHREKLDNVDVFRCPLFVPRKPTTITRLLHLLSFALSSMPAILRQWVWKPDVIIGIEPTFFCAPTQLFLSKVTGAKSLLHIQDFELDAMLGLGMAKNGRRAAVCLSVESYFMRRFAAISSISNAMLTKVANKTRQSVPIHLFPNWVDTDFVSPDVDAQYFRQLWNIPDSTQVVLYSGNLGKKQGLELLVEAAKMFASEPDVLFLILGDGVERQSLIDQAKELNLANIRFESLQPYQYLPKLMALADAHVVIQKKGVANAVMPSKLATILSAGGYTLITAEKKTELGRLCKKFPGIAECVEPENVELFVTELRRMLHTAKTGRPRVNQIARQYALDYLNKQVVLEEFESMLLSLTDDTDTPMKYKLSST